jgi:hypothetical protein
MSQKHLDGIDIESLKKEIKQEFVKQKILESLEDDEINLSQYLSILGRHKITLLIVPVIMAIAASILFNDGKFYKSQATIFIHGMSQVGAQQSALSGLLGGLGLGGGAAGNSGSGYLNVLLKSKKLEKEAFKLVRIASYAEEVLPNYPISKLLGKEWKKTKFEADGALTFEMETRSATLSMELINSYLTLLETNMKRPEKKKRMYLEKQVSQTVSDLQTMEKNLKEFQEKQQCLTFDTKAAPLFSKFYSLKEQVLEIDISEPINEKLLKVLGRIPDLMRIEIQKLTDETKRATLQKVLPEFEKQLENLPGLALEYKRLERDLKIKEKLFALFIEQFEMAKINDVVEDSQIELIDPPELGSPVPGKQLQKIVAAAVVGFFLALMLVIFQEFGASTPEDEEKEKQKQAA